MLQRSKVKVPSDMPAKNARSASRTPPVSRNKRPNILYIMFDQLAPQFLPSYGHKVVQAPNLSRLAAEGVQFDSAYTNSPLCAPGRFSMMAGQLASRIGAWDNAAEFRSDIPTFAHYLRLAGYRTCLSGKMHFVGPDQLHGFEDRVTTDMYPGDFGWTPTWEEPKKIHWWFHNMLSVTEAGPYDRSLEMEHDDEVAYTSMRWLHDHARGDDQRPFMLCVSFMQPHDPYLGPRRDWESYRDDDIDLPAVPYIAPAKRDAVDKRLYDLYDRDEYRVTEAHVRAARRGYYAMITYTDRLMGQVLEALRQTGQADNTIIVVSADHGDMMGERGLWYKMNFYERAIRVPLIVAGPGIKRGQRIRQAVSQLDLLPTFRDLCGTPADEGLDGASLWPSLMRGVAPAGSVLGEYCGEGADAPVAMIRRGRHKFIRGPREETELYDLDSDPGELRNLAREPAFQDQVRELSAEAEIRWDFAALRDAVIASQHRRRLVHSALVTGRVTPWDYAPRLDAARLYYRNYEPVAGDPDGALRRPRPRR